jgi:hypothetical protein
MELRPWQRNSLSVLVIAVGAYVLLLAAFLVYALLINGAISLFNLPDGGLVHPIGRIVLTILLYLATWAVLRSALPVLVKATALTLPLMVTVVMAGIFLHAQPLLVNIFAGALIIGAVAVYLSVKKLSWKYWFATGYVAALALAMVVFQVEI